MKRFASYVLYMLLLSAATGGCNDSLDIRRDYDYRVETLPLPEKLKKGESVALEFSIIREGYYAETTFKFRYFQSEGEGFLYYGGLGVPVNRFRDIASDDFVLRYESACEEQQQLDFVFENSFGKRVEYTVTFSSERTEEEKEQ